MSSTSAIYFHTRRNSKAEDLKDPQLEEMINLDKDKAKSNQENKEEVQKATEKKPAERGREPAIMLGENVWENLTQKEDKLKGTNFMDWLEKELGKDDCKKVRRDIKKALLNRKD